MTVVNAMELHRYGVRANCIAPVARTRLTLQTPGMSDSMEQHVFDPECVSPLVAVLASETCPFNGQVFSVYGGSVGIYAGWSIAESVETDDRWTLRRWRRPWTRCPGPSRSTARSPSWSSTWGADPKATDVMTAAGPGPGPGPAGSCPRSWRWCRRTSRTRRPTTGPCGR